MKLSAKKQEIKETSSIQNSSSECPDRKQVFVKALFLSLVMFLSGSSVFAEFPNKSFTVYGFNGEILDMPLKYEVAEELPDEIVNIFGEIKDSIINQQFDISSMVKPEADTDDLDIDTRKIFKQMNR